MKHLLMLFIVISLSYYSTAQESFVHTTTRNNCSGSSTSLTSKYTSKYSYIVTHNWGTGGKYNNHPLAVKETRNGVKIINADGSNMIAGLKFNVLVIPKNLAVQKHVVKSNNRGHISIIDNPNWNGNRNVKLLVTQVDNGDLNTNPVGIYYAGNKWAIYNQNKRAMPRGAAYNIYECADCEIVTAKKPSGNYYDFYKNKGNTNAKLFATQYWTSVYNPHFVGLWYNNGKWSVFNEDRQSMPANSKFIIGKGLTPRKRSEISATYTTVQKPGIMTLTFSGIAVDDHPENTWGEVKYCLQRKTKNGWEDVKPQGRSNAWINWSKRKSNPIMCYPLPKDLSAISNINKPTKYNVNQYGLDHLNYRIKYTAKLTCNHKDNFMAADGDNSMKKYVTDYIKLYVTDNPKVFTMNSKRMKTSSNRDHWFTVQYTATVANR